ncbi:MAG TPA: antibiotic biosynthesis monooxygenase [Dehalococcoidia bacterium]|nr:antibiotic biosynthesis monooxygenase [Dehalococcoidia bacterium]
MFVAMNRFKVNPGKEGDFETQWRERETYLEDVPGFQQFMLLRSDSAGDYISHTIWQDRQSFMDWTQSENFAKGHRQGSLMGVLQGPPEIALYEAVLVEAPTTG